MLSQRPRWKSQAGYTVIEMVIVGAICITGMVMAIPMTMRMVQSAKGDSAQVMTATFLESGRNRAVAERRNIQLTILDDSSMQLERIEVPSGLHTVVATLQLEDLEEFLRDPDLPDTPDVFGGLDAVNFTGTAPVMFTSDGSLIDSAGDVTNATIFIQKPDFPDTIRAVTVSGVTGMMRSWKWRGTSWLQ